MTCLVLLQWRKMLPVNKVKDMKVSNVCVFKSPTFFKITMETPRGTIFQDYFNKGKIKHNKKLPCPNSCIPIAFF